MSENTNTSLEVGKRIFESKDLMLTGEQIMAQIRVVDWVKTEVMKLGVHYGEPYPGAPKKSLWKPGAEKLCLAFRVSSTPTVEDLSTQDEIRYRVTAVGHHILTGQNLGSGVGECSSNEEKYKWRAVVSDEEFEATSSDRKREKFNKDGSRTKQIRTNPADLANTILKMADKRANTAMAIKVTAASDIFDQDLEDMDDVNYQRTDKNGSAKPKGKPTSSGTEGNFHIKNWTAKQGGTAEKPWTKYTIVTEEGDSFGTFTESHKNEALRLKNAGIPAHIVWKKSQYGNDIISLAEAKIEPAPAAEEKKTEPASN